MHFAGFSDKKISISQLMAESDTARYKWGSRKVAYIQRIDSLGKRFAIWARLGQGIPHLLSIGVMLNVVWNMPCTCHCAR